LFITISAFDPLRIRLGGSLQDQLVYQVGDFIKKFPHFKKQDDGLFGFSKGSLPMDRWDQLNDLFKQTKCVYRMHFTPSYSPRNMI
jgi:heparanase 1